MLQFPVSKRTNSQDVIYTSWKTTFQAIGTVVAATGWGKTSLAWRAIDEQNTNRPNRIIHVVVPSTNLKDDWENEEDGYIKLFGFFNVQVFVVNTYIKEQRNCDLLILDEYHRFGAETFSDVFEKCAYRFLLALTATIEREDGMHELLLRKAPLVATVTQEECEREGYTSKKKTFNLAIELTETEAVKLNELNKLFSDTIKKFGEVTYKENAFDIAMGCSKGRYNFYSAYIRAEEQRFNMSGDGWRRWWALKNGWDGSKEHYWSPANIQKAAGTFNYAMNARKELLYKAENKIDATLKIIQKHKDRKAIVFGERTDFLDNLAHYLTSSGIKAKVIHSKINGEIRSKPDMFDKDEVLASGRKIEGKVKYICVKTGKQYSPIEVRKAFPNSVKISKEAYEKEVIREFKTGIIDVLLAAIGYDEGLDVSDIELNIITSGKGIKRQQIQREGRALRFIEDKLAIIVNMYVANSQEESWLKKRLDTNYKKSYFVTDTNDVDLNFKEFSVC